MNSDHQSQWRAASFLLEELVDAHEEPKVQVRSKPTRGVFAMEAHKAKTLTIIPLALSLRLVEGTDCPPLFMTYSGKRYSISNPGKDLPTLAFLVRSSTREEDCNCTLKKVKSKDDDYRSIIECTVITNTKKIGVGDELVILRDKVVKPAPNKNVLSPWHACRPRRRPSIHDRRCMCSR
mgnify:CR=1 FL=1